MLINIISLGRLKDKWIKDGCAEYIKMLGAYCTVKETELAPVRLPDEPNVKQIQSALDAEAEMILAAVPKGSAVIALCIEGKLMSSEALAERLAAFALDGRSTVCVIIGSSCGLSDKVKSRADLKLSMSPMTFPHRLAKVMIAEQLYRALNINAGGKYHK